MPTKLGMLENHAGTSRSCCDLNMAGGPWPALGWGGTADWDFDINVEGGRFVQYQPCFTTGPMDEFRRDRIVSFDDKHIEVRSFTGLKQQVDDYSQKAIVLKVQGDANTKVTVTCRKPTNCSLTQTFAQLAESNEMLFTRPFPWESAMLHRLTFAANYKTDFTVNDTDDGSGGALDGLNWYYVRVVQANGELAWSSPIWVEGEAK